MPDRADNRLVKRENKQNRTEQNRTEQNRTKQNKSERKKDKEKEEEKRKKSDDKQNSTTRQNNPNVKLPDAQRQHEENKRDTIRTPRPVDSARTETGTNQECPTKN